VQVSLAERALSITERAVCVVVTRIIDFRVEPTLATPGETITIVGKLQQHWPPMICTWGGLTDFNVDLYVNDVKRATATTGPDGAFEFRTSFREYGTYWVKVHYPGNAWYCPSWSDEVAVKVVSEEEKEKAEEEARLRELLFWLGVGGAAAAVIGGIIYLIDRERRLRELELVLAARR